MKPKLNCGPTSNKYYYIPLGRSSLDHYKITKSMVKISKLVRRPIKTISLDIAIPLQVIYEP